MKTCLPPMHPQREILALPLEGHFPPSSRPLQEQELRERMQVYIEYREPASLTSVVSLIDFRRYGRTWCYVFTGHLTLSPNYYGRSWRCWIRKPTAAQRRAAKWPESFH